MLIFHIWQHHVQPWEEIIKIAYHEQQRINIIAVQVHLFHFVQFDTDLCHPLLHPGKGNCNENINIPYLHDACVPLKHAQNSKVAVRGFYQCEAP